MKIALLGDVHFSIFGNSPAKSVIFQENIKKFFDEIFFPRLKKDGIRVIWQTGDMFDNRKANNTEAIANAKECFFSKLAPNHIELHTIIGNHDMFFKESMRVTSPEQLLSEYHSHVYIYKTPVTRKFDSLTVDMIPWICEENHQHIGNFIGNTKSPYAFGHFEFIGFEMSKGHVAEHGVDRDSVILYEKVVSGHYHRASESGNIKYLGSPSQHTWDDADEERGFYILDTETKQIEFIPNPFNLFVRISYDDTTDIRKTPDVENKYVKIVYQNVDRTRLEKFIDEINSFAPLDVKTVDLTVVSNEYEISLEEIESDGFETVKFLTDYIITNNTDLTPDEADIVRNLCKEIHEEVKQEQ